MSEEVSDPLPKKSTNITVRVEYTDPNGEAQKVDHFIKEGVVWIQKKMEIRPTHLEALRTGEEARVPATCEVRVSYESFLKGT